MNPPKENQSAQPSSKPKYLPVKFWNLTPTRLEAFSDGVFAIVATLLVIEIRVPQIHGEGTSGLGHELTLLIPKILCYIMSFLYICIYWVNHHLLFHVIKRVNVGLFWCNNFFLMCLAFIPFPTALIGEYPKEPSAVIFYGAVVFATGLSFFIMKWYAVDHGRLTDPAYGDDLFRQTLLRILIGPILYCIAIIVAFFCPSLSIVIYVLVPLIYIFPEKLEGKVRE